MVRIGKGEVRMTRNGKIARLPSAVREELNIRLHDGEMGKELVAWLNSVPEVQASLKKYLNGHAVTEQNLSEWRTGGFEEWQRQQASAEFCRTLGENSAELQLESNGGDSRPTGYRSLADRLAVVLTVDAFQYRRSVMQAELDPKLRWEILKQLLEQVSKLRKDDHRQARLMLDQQRIAQEEERKAAAAKEVQAEKLRNQQEQSYWALLRWGPLVRLFGGGELGKFYADAIIRLQTGVGPVEVPEHLKAALEAFKEILAKGGPLSAEDIHNAMDPTESDPIQADPTGNSAAASGQAVGGQPGQSARPSAPSPSVAPNPSESDSIRLDPTKKPVGTMPPGQPETPAPAFDMRNHRFLKPYRELPWAREELVRRMTEDQLVGWITAALEHPVYEYVNEKYLGKGHVPRFD